MEQIDPKTKVANKIREAVKALNQATEEATELGLKVELVENVELVNNLAPYSTQSDVQLYGPRWSALITETTRY